MVFHCFLDNLNPRQVELEHILKTVTLFEVH
jgi:hypothetical protein